MTVAFEIQSVCECQALLTAELDEQQQVIRGFALPHLPGALHSRTPETAPANSVGAPADRFDVVWQCPVCGRNTLRTFHAASLRRSGDGTKAATA